MALGSSYAVGNFMCAGKESPGMTAHDQEDAAESQQACQTSEGTLDKTSKLVKKKKRQNCKKCSNFCVSWQLLAVSRNRRYAAVQDWQRRNGAEPFVCFVASASAAHSDIAVIISV